MKNLIFCTYLFLSQICFASVLEVNEFEKNVYYHPTPVLELDLIDLQNDGGMLMVSLNYDSIATKNEEELLQAQYPEYKLQPIMGEVTQPSMTFSIPSLDVRKQIVLRQGQMGPYLNTSIDLSKAQVVKLKKSKDEIVSSLSLTVPIHTNYNTVAVKESFELNQAFCLQFKARNLADVISIISKFVKPEAIQYQQTFDDLKLSILGSCFSINKSVANSFSELLKTPVIAIQPRAPIRGQFSEVQNRSEVHNINPTTKVEIN